MLRTCAAPLSHPLARMVDQDPSHRLGGGGEEMRPAIPLRILIRTNSEPRLVDQGRRLKRMARRLSRHPRRCEMPQLIIDEREQLAGRLRVSTTDPLQDERDT